MSSLSSKTHVFQVFKGKEFTFASEWLRTKGASLKAWWTSRVMVANFCLLGKNWPSNPAPMWWIWRQLWPRGGGVERTNLQMPRGLPGEILNLRIDRRIDQGNPLQCDLENLAKIFYEFYHRSNYYKLLSWCRDISWLFTSHC